jgi:hypothetical protein
MERGGKDRGRGDGFIRVLELSFTADVAVDAEAGKSNTFLGTEEQSQTEEPG